MSCVRFYVTERFEHDPRSPEADAEVGGRVVAVALGQIIGRSVFAGLRIDHPRISEAHALLSQREGVVRLLALRRRFLVDGRPAEDVALVEGLAIELAPGVTVEVLEVLPARMLALSGAGLPRVPLPDVASIVAGGPGELPRLTRGFDDAARAWLWAGPDGHRLRLHDAARHLAAGDTFEVDGHRFEVLALDPSELDVAPTHRWEAEGLTLIARWDTFHIQRAGAIALIFDGVPARILSELAVTRVPLDWLALAREVWSDERDPNVLRGRLDVNLGRIRRKLRTAELRPELVRATGVGHVELALGPNDVIVDET